MGRLLQHLEPQVLAAVHSAQRTRHNQPCGRGVGRGGGGGHSFRVSIAACATFTWTCNFYLRRHLCCKCRLIPEAFPKGQVLPLHRSQNPKRPNSAASIHGPMPPPPGPTPTQTSHSQTMAGLTPLTTALTANFAVNADASSSLHTRRCTRLPWPWARLTRDLGRRADSSRRGLGMEMPVGVGSEG